MARVYDKLIEHAERNRLPLSAAIELTYRCNFRCAFCYVDQDACPDELDLAAWTRIFKDIRSAGVVTLLFTGGEVFIRPDAMDILRAARETGFLVSLYTNGSMIDEAMAAELARLKLVDIGITLYGADAPAHDAYSHCAGSFARVIAAAKALRDGGSKVILRWHALPETIGQTEAFIDLAEGLGLRWQANGIISSRRAGGHSGRVSRSDLEEFHRLTIDRFHSDEDLQATVTRTREDMERPADPDEPICSAGRCSFRVAPEGSLFPCMELGTPVGRLTDEPLSAIWARVEDTGALPLMELHHYAECKTCRDVHVCLQRCPAAFKQETGSYYSAAAENCRNTAAYVAALAACASHRLGAALPMSMSEACKE